MTKSTKWRVCLTSAASAVVLVVAPLVGAQAAHAQHPPPPYPPPPPCLTLGATTATAGGAVNFRATGFAPWQPVTASLDWNPIVLGRYRADASGTADATATIPNWVRTGWHTFKVTARNPNLTCSARIKVRAADHDGHEHDGYNGHWPDGEGGGNGHNGSGRPDHGPDIADTSSEKALAASGIAAGLIAAGRGTMLAVRRRRSA
ncbi:hypothetical protein [Streptomyces sp. NPDC060031]|uniref:hypothetical protein n=1 Tax=Streptomyces sp. NPDC060031 TaxID=3347043 RepID=UPI0036761D1C